MSRGNRDSAGHPAFACGSQTAAAATNAGAAPSQPSMAKTLFTDAATKGDRVTKKELWKWRSGGKRGNPKTGFPLFPPLLGNLAKAARFPHSHSSDDEAVEKWK